MQQDGDQFKVEADLRLHVVEFEPPKYQMLKETLREIELALRKMPVFALKSDSAGPVQAWVRVCVSVCLKSAGTARTRGEKKTILRPLEGRGGGRRRAFG